MLNILSFKNSLQLTGQADEKLMLMYAKGNPVAFEKLYSKYKDSVYRFVHHQIKHTETSEEIFQDIWTKLINNRTNYIAYKNKASFKTWLFKLARNTVVDYFRAQGRAKNWQAQFETDELGIPASDIQEPEVAFEQNLLAEHLLEAIYALPELQREAFLLKEEAGLSLKEIATTTKATPETVKSRLRYAYKKLRAQLEGVKDE